MGNVRSEVIFVGTVQGVSPPPRYWSGPLASYQEVRYRVDETITGDIPGPELVVVHAVVSHSPTAEPGDIPSLSTRLFGQGARLLVMGIVDSRGRCFAASEHFGAMPYSRLLVEQVRAAAAASRPSLAVH